MIEFVKFTNVNPTIQLPLEVLGLKRRINLPLVAESVEIVPETVVVPINLPIAKKSSNSSLISTDIEDIFKQAGLTAINGKLIRFGNRNIRALNANFGAKNSNHKKRDPHTGYAMARDISIVGGNLDDYTEFRKLIMSNELINKYMDTKGWGIINEVTPLILARTRGTGLHFHFGPDTWARRTWAGWKANPNTPITTAL